jgi:hypothetical protein
MKQLYFFDESERNRILNLHESATKNQYLINEQSADKDIAARLYSASRGPGTGSDFLLAIQAISSLQQLTNVDTLLKRGYSQLGLQGQINDEFNPQEATDRASLEMMKAHLAKLGATMTFDQNRNESVAINYQSTVQGQPEVPAAQNIQQNLGTQEDWNAKYPCFQTFKNAKLITSPDPNKGQFAYRINKSTYFADGYMKVDGGQLVTYSQGCNDPFLLKEPKKDGGSQVNNTQQPYKHAKSLQSVQTKLKEVDPNFSSTDTTKMDQATINKIYNLLTAKETPKAAETPAKQETPAQSTSTSDLASTAD